MKSNSIIKALFSLTLAFLPLSAAVAQSDISQTYGIYEGEATTIISDLNRENQTPGTTKKIRIEISEEQNNFAKIILKDYTIDNFSFKDIILPENFFTFENGIWKIEQNSNIENFFETKDGKDKVLLTILIPNEKSNINTDKTLEFHFSIIYKKSILEHVFKGKKQVNTGIVELEAERKSGITVFQDLQGRRVEHPEHGIYIVNGKKVLIM
ncbi:hypothetical protein [Prevotella sp. OH937_COT-195]|uniref:hypothetical protein n=1 Tax=Prevotella sp. OH937_COT-195 TaxID=2491051 RepID=UPI000F6547A8|nr:hypothetical protein [Prevotella sp. OH937_COT-195]RRD02733.1 hypothetical protein EII32_01600 [Prevotella sp. OH937_COT-195]